MKLDKHHVGLTLGLFFGLLHLLWVIVVGAGWGQPLADWWHNSHFLTDRHSIAAFSGGTGLFGVIYALIAGYLVGLIFASIWNAAGKK